MLFNIHTKPTPKISLIPEFEIGPVRVEMLFGSHFPRDEYLCLPAFIGCDNDNNQKVDNFSGSLALPALVLHPPQLPAYFPANERPPREVESQ